MDSPKQLNTINAKVIHLPILQFGKDRHTFEKTKHTQNTYWNIYNKAFAFYKNQNYQKAKEEFLKIYNWYHSSDSYYIYLLRTYRKIVNRLIERTKYTEAISEMDEMFKSCTNTTSTDIKKYNKLVALLTKSKPEFEKIPRKLNINTKPRFIIHSDFIEYQTDCKKPRGLKIPKSIGTSIVRLIELSDYLPRELPYLHFNNSGAKYTFTDKIPSLRHDVYRFRESKSRNAFIVSTKDLNIYLYNWKLDLLWAFNASDFSEQYTHLRRVEISSDCSLALFTNIDIVYMFDSKFSVLSSWEVPHKAEWQKRKKDSLSDYKDYITILNLDKNYNLKEIKTAFRKLALIYHPDRNPHDKLADSKMIKIIEAYECLTNEKAIDAFKGEENEEYWVKTIHDFEFDIMGLNVSIDISFGGSGEDWIYGSGISNNAEKIYLGCYSGKTYQINMQGIVEKIYIIPEDVKGIYGKTNPVTYIVECEKYLHIMTYWYLYILLDDTVLRYLKVYDGIVKWYDRGFIKQLKNNIYIYLNNGDFIGSLEFKDKIRHICYKDNVFLIETITNAYIFKLKY